MSTQIPVNQRKICLLGDFAIGKTSLVRRFVYNVFDERYLTTIGVNITRKEVEIDDKPPLNLVIWDLASSDKYEDIRAHYLHGISGALLVCDLSRPETIDKLKTVYVDQLFSNNPKASVVVLGNKIDLVSPEAESIKMLKTFAEGLNAAYLLTSAKTGENVENAFNLLAADLQ